MNIWRRTYMSDNKLQLKQLFFGKTDAYNELLECGPDQFKRSFLKNDAYSIDDFLSGLKYYIYGDKGTGKTAFLKYIWNVYYRIHQKTW